LIAYVVLRDRENINTQVARVVLMSTKVAITVMIRALKVKCVNLIDFTVHVG